MIYLGVPYSHPNYYMRELRFQAATWYAGLLISRGENVFSPITHSHPMALKFDLPASWEYWAEFDSAILKLCSEMRVLQLPGWGCSAGLQAEMELAEEHGIPITMISTDSEDLHPYRLNLEIHRLYLNEPAFASDTAPAAAAS